MNVEDVKLGMKVQVRKSNESSFLIPKIQKGEKMVDAPSPWYPHRQEAVITSISDHQVRVRTMDGKDWPHPLFTWNVDPG